MSDIAELRSQLQRSLGDLEASLAGAAAWRDPQRARLEKHRVEPIRLAARRYLAALGELDATFDDARRMLNQ